MAARLRIGVCLGLAVLFLYLPTAQAQSTVAQVEQLALDGEFDAAIQGCRAILAGDGLNLEELAHVLELLAYSYSGTGDEAQVAATIEQLALVAPDHEFQPNTPPRVVQMHRAQAGVALETDVSVEQPSPDELLIRASAPLAESVEGLVREVRVYARGEAQEWRSGASQVSLSLSESAIVDYYASTLGPGGAEISANGTRESPLRWPADEDGFVGGGGNTGDDEGGVPLWVWIGGSALLVATAVVVVALIATGGSLSDNTVVGAPMLP